MGEFRGAVVNSISSLAEGSHFRHSDGSQPQGNCGSTHMPCVSHTDARGTSKWACCRVWLDTMLVITLMSVT